jgi:hypothetical protein
VRGYPVRRPRYGSVLSLLWLSVGPRSCGGAHRDAKTTFSMSFDNPIILPAGDRSRNRIDVGLPAPRSSNRVPLPYRPARAWGNRFFDPLPACVQRPVRRTARSCSRLYLPAEPNFADANLVKRSTEECANFNRTLDG